MAYLFYNLSMVLNGTQSDQIRKHSLTLYTTLQFTSLFTINCVPYMIKWPIYFIIYLWYSMEQSDSDQIRKHSLTLNTTLQYKHTKAHIFMVMFYVATILKITSFDKV